MSALRSFLAFGGLHRPRGVARSARALAAMLVILAAAGCSTSESEDDHHMEHFVPEHKPASFKGAVDALAERTSHLQYHVGDSGEIVQQELTELADIIGWIPELAADSDLNETDWTEAVRVSTQMLSVYEQSSVAGDLKSLLADLPPLIESLQPLVPKAGRPEPSMRHDHDHGHHHDHDEHGKHNDHDDHPEHTEPAEQDSQHTESDSNDQE